MKRPRRIWPALLGLSLCAASSAARTGPAEPPVVFAVLGDVHIGLRGEDGGMKMTGSSARLFEMAVDQLNETPGLSFVVFAGDLVINGESFNLARFKEIADRLRVPYFVVLGNHDQPVVPSAREWSPQARAFYPGETKASIAALFRGHGFGPDGQTWWSANLDGVHLVGLDAVQVMSGGGTIPRQELDWLKKDLSARPARRTLVFMHHNLVESHPDYQLPKTFLVDDRDEVKRTLASFPQVKAVFSAHYHFSDHNAESGVHYFTTPSINTYPCRYALFALTPTTLDMRTHLVGEGGERRAEADAIRARAKEEIVKAKDWFSYVARALKDMGKPSDDASVRAGLRGLFESASAVGPLPLRASPPRH